MKKICRLCKCSKDLEEFHKASCEADGKESRCKVCILAFKSKNYYKNHEENKERSRIKSLEFRKQNKGYQRRYDLKRIYGITLEDYDNMLLSQDNKCKICKTSDPGGVHKKFYVDHCHATGEVRGLLCTGCNLALGGFRDNIENLKIAIRYLEEKGKI
jgi:hypothetical protein